MHISAWLDYSKLKLILFNISYYEDISNIQNKVSKKSVCEAWGILCSIQLSVLNWVCEYLNCYHLSTIYTCLSLRSMRDSV